MPPIAKIIILLIMGMLAAKGVASTDLPLDPAANRIMVSRLEVNVAKEGNPPQWLPYDGFWQVSLARSMVWTRFTVNHAGPQPIERVLTNEIRCAHMLAINLNHLALPRFGGYLHLAEQAGRLFAPAVTVILYPGPNTFYVGFHPEGQASSIAMSFWKPAHFEQRQKMVVLLTFVALGGYAILTTCTCFIILTHGASQAFFLLLAMIGYLAFAATATGFFDIFGEHPAFLAQPFVYFELAIGAIFGLLFACAFFDFSRKSPAVMKSIYSACLLTGLLSLSYSVTGSKLCLYFSWIGCLIIGITICSINLAMLRMKLPYALSFIGVTFTFLPLVPLGAFLSGLIVYPVNLQLTLIGSGISSATALFLIMIHRISTDYAAKGKLEKSITLGRSVQNLLLPHDLSYQGNGFDAQFIYHPYEEQMSGDWVNYWRTSDGNVHLVIGDVVGKGPPAALAVATIASIIDRCIQNDIGLEKCCSEINMGLFRLFKGGGQTTISAATITMDNKVILYNSGGLGWFITRGSRVLHQLTPGRFLGQERDFKLDTSTFVLMPGDLLFSFTDGVCEGTKAHRKLSLEVAELLAIGGDVVTYFHEKIGKVKVRDVHDDRTAIVIRYNGQERDSKTDPVSLAEKTTSMAGT